MLERLTETGWPSQTWSAPGYDGQPIAHPYSLSRLAALLEDELRPETGPVVLVGHSMGGMLALTCAAQWSHPPAAMILLCTVPAFQLRGAAREEFLTRRLAGIDTPTGMRGAAERLIPTLVAESATPETIAQAVAVMAAISPETYRQAVTALTDFDLRPHLARMEMPILCLSGVEDRVSTPAHMAALAAALPNAAHRTHDRAGHLLPQEQPAWVAAQIHDFLTTRCIPATKI